MDAVGQEGRRGKQSSLESSIIHNSEYRVPRTRKNMASMYNDALDIPESENESQGGMSLPVESMEGNSSIPVARSSEVPRVQRSNEVRGVQRSNGVPRVQRQRRVQIEELGEFKFKFKFFDGLNEHFYDVDSLSALFPQFSVACHRFAEEQSFPPAVFVSVAAYTLPEASNRSKRFQVYRRLAWAAGWAERTKMPDYVEEAVKQTWSEAGETFVGFIEAN